MAQEQTELQTQNSGGLLASLGNFVNTLATPAANLYTLKLQGDVLKQQAAGTLASAQANAAANANPPPAATSAEMQKKWMLWGGIAVAVLVVLTLLLRRRN